MSSIRLAATLAFSLAFVSLAEADGFRLDLKNPFKRDRSSTRPVKKAGSSGPDRVIHLPARPTSMDQFLAFRDQIAKTPEGGVAVYLVAAWMYGEDQELGLDAFTVAYHRSRLRKAGNSGYKGFRPVRTLDSYIGRLKEKPWLFHGYVQGANPQNNYVLPDKPRIRLFRNRYSDLGGGKIKVFARTTGADSPRPFTVKANKKGLWKVVEASSFYAGAKPPASASPDAVVDDL
jgi:hypothetical protein